MLVSMLGNLAVSAIGLGCASFSSIYGKTDDEESLRTLDFALNNGITFFDTADYYGLGHNEELLGKALKGRRDHVVIGTKFGMRRTADGFVIDGRPAYLKQACEDSLLRLGTDYIDLYYLHRVDRNVPIEDTVGAMAALVTTGKVRALGLSEVSSGTLRRAQTVYPITALQSEYSLWTRDIEDDILPTCRELGIGLVPFAPLGRGLLAGTTTSAKAMEPDDYRTPLPRFHPDNFENNRLIVDELADWGSRRGWTSAQIALAWLKAQGNDIAPIPATRKFDRLRENIAAADIVFSADDLREIESICPRGAAAGERTTPSLLAFSES